MDKNKLASILFLIKKYQPQPGLSQRFFNRKLNVAKLTVSTSESSTPEKELTGFRRREALLEATERIAKIGHYQWNFKHERLVSCSAEFAGIFDMTIEQAINSLSSWENMLACVHPEDRQVYKATSAALRVNKSLDTDYRLLLKSGVIKHVREYGIIIRDEQGEELSVFGLLQDVTSQFKHERELAYRDELSRQAESITDIGHFIYDEISEAHLHISEGYARIYGTTSEAFLSDVRNLEDELADIHKDDRAMVEQEYRRYMESGRDCVIEFRIHRADGEVRWIRELTRAYRKKGNRVAQTIGVIQDITERIKYEQEIIRAKSSLEQQVADRTNELANTIKQLQSEIIEREAVTSRLNFLANHDALTGLPSLRLCKDRLERSIIDAQRNKQLAAVMFLDLDGFKAINDSYGHELGDEVLKRTAKRIQIEIRETDTVARIGGDEFLIILSSLPDIKIVERIAANLINRIAEPIELENISVSISSSIGIALYPHNGSTTKELIRNADTTMYAVKNSGKNNFRFV